jgi:hypothetical protein
LHQPPSGPATREHCSSTAPTKYRDVTRKPAVLGFLYMDMPGSLEHWRGADLIAITRLQHATAETRKHHAHVANGLRMCAVDSKVCMAASRSVGQLPRTPALAAQRVMGILLSTDRATSSQRLVLSARASDLPAERSCKRMSIRAIAAARLTVCAGFSSPGLESDSNCQLRFLQSLH